MEHGAIRRDIANVNNSAEKELEDYFNAEADDVLAPAETAPTADEAEGELTTDNEQTTDKK
jgi:hypothetical protein